MLILGVILLLVGFIIGVPLLVTLGFIALAVGFVMLLVGAVGGPTRTYGGRRYWY